MSGTVDHRSPPVRGPVLDVLIPHHADPVGLSEALDSVAAQNWLREASNRLRVIVVDDGSDPADFTAAQHACARFRDSSGQALVLERLPQNLGRPAARNRLLDMADAPYLAWLDAGDVWYPDKLEAQFACLATLEAAGDDPRRLWVSCAYDFAQGGRRRPRQQAVAGDQLHTMLMGDHLRAYLWTLLGRAEAFRIAGRFDTRLPRLQDLDYCLTFLRAGGLIVVPPDPAPMCCYYKSDLGRDADQIAACYRLILAKNAPCIRQYPRAFRARLRHKAAALAARFARSNGEHGKAARYLLQAALTNPSHSLALTAHGARRRLQTWRARIAPVAR